MPKVSVIIPTYNRSNLIVTAINSVLKQYYRDLEIIVVDDKSTDNTKLIVESFKDNRIKYVLNDGSKGPSAARNKGIKISKGEYIAFLDDDDEWLPEKLKLQINLMNTCGPNICGVHSKIKIIDKMSGSILPYNLLVDKLNGNLLKQLTICCPLVTPTVILRKSCLDKVGLFDESMSYSEDRDLWIRLSMEYDFEYIDEPLVKVYIHRQDHLSKNLYSEIIGREKLFNKYEELFKLNRKRWSQYLLGLGVMYFQVNKMKSGREKVCKSIYIYPFNIMAYGHFASSFLGPDYYQIIRKFYKKYSNIRKMR